MAIRRSTVTVTGATGGVGVATASAVSNKPIDGIIVGVHLTFVDSPPATADTTIEEANNSPAMPIITETNYNTDGWLFPVNSVVDATGTAITNGYQEVHVQDYVRVTIAQVNDGDGVTAVIVWDDQLGIGRRQ